MNNIFIEFLKSLKPSELDNFTDFINSPFFNKNKNISKLTSELLKFYPEFENKNLTDEKIYFKISGKKEFNKKIFNNLISEANKISSDFYKLVPFLKNDLSNDFNLLREYNNRKLDSRYHKLKSEIDNKISSEDVNINFFREKLSLAKNQVEFLIYRTEYKNIIENLYSRSDYLIYDFVLKLFYDYQEMITFSNLRNEEFKDSLTYKVIDSLNFEEILKNFDKKNHTDDFEKNYFQMYYFFIKALKNLNDDESYFNFKNLLIKLIDRFNYTEKNANLLRLNNLIVYKINFENKISLVAEELEVYKLMLKFGTYNYGSAKKNFRIITFRNIILVCFEIKDKTFLKHFLDKYTSEVSDEYRDDMYNYGMLYLEFLNGNFNKSLEHINKVNYSHFLFKTDIRTISLMTHYELGNYETAFSLVDSFSKFLERNDEVNDYIFEVNKEFLKYFTDVLKIKTGKDNTDSDFLLNKISQRYSKENLWLAEKIKEIKNGD
ncbi:MAG TPA: hypothetical protein PLG90_08510 [Ignavibacteria bacterium]|nr:hypothetical protein [Ignavibacteria bacterium]